MTVSKNITLKRIESSAEEHPLWFLGGALGAGLLLGKVAPQLIGGILRLGGGLAWRFVVLPKLAETLAATVESNLGGRRRPSAKALPLPIDKDRALEMFGLMSRPSSAGRAASTTGLLAAGLVAGAGLGLAFAPRPGTELRRELVKRLHLNGHEQAEAALDQATSSTR
jgi:hypothetical protein